MIAISAKNIAKKYLLGSQASGSLRETFSGLLNSREGQKEFWALKDIDFEINQGDLVGIVGNNGAGKSTLLKILSRITPPTTGRIEINGRIASLLEVGTGFHPELTGRQNIFLNGAILGMKKPEIKSKLDEIIAFSGIEEFIDTPVKRYSSGMYVRLAFAVAAHLEPEILIIDEVLAVGDSEFQRKCIGKMESVSQGQGRTVLFVSHNMAIIQSLCQKGIYLKNGRIAATGDIRSVVQEYVAGSSEHSRQLLADRKDRQGNGKVLFQDWYLSNMENQRVEVGVSGKGMKINLRYSALHDYHKNVLFWIQFLHNGSIVFTCHNQLESDLFVLDKKEGIITCTFKKLPLFAGVYTFRLLCKVNGEFADYIDNAGEIHIENGDFFGTGRLPQEKEGFLIEHSWNKTE